ncbi:tetratricopeptide repeat protein [Streptomyces sp. HPF1205]|uniref:tetratricopeptide repeat protein n=1 Tax=Streptomyces sp. HPF1205 TaxID=2873262 RepID=UPI001CED290A|nr:tetratricopeptide repeat protein [Streptomyces sp. HPF1205]
MAGLAGVGKTTLVHAAGHAAHERGWFTGVLLVGLRGYDPSPAQPENILDALLRSLGVEAAHIPPTASEREALYRSELDARERAGERLLVIADNASSVEQVRLLLPPGRHGLLVTSRRSLSGLGRLRILNLLQPQDAVTLLDAALRNANPEDSRVKDDPEAAERVALACGCLPLALQITAALLTTDPGQPLAERADHLTSGEQRLEELDDGERSLRAAFDQSFDRLPPQQAELFTLLSLNPGPDISTTAAAALVGQPDRSVDQLLGQLATFHFIQRSATRGRWQIHDLLREYATARAVARAATSGPARRRHDEARTRLMNYYTRTTQAASGYVDRSQRTTTARVFGNRARALEWLDAERPNLIAITHAGGATQQVMHLAVALGPYLEWRRQLHDLVAIQSLALDVCREIEDRHNEPNIWNNLGNALHEVRRYEDAIQAYETALALYQQHNDPDSEANTWTNLGSTLCEVRRFDEAITAHENALALHKKHKNPSGEGNVWNHFGIVLRGMRRFDEAITAHENALALHKKDKNPDGEANSWHSLGIVLHEVRRLDEAMTAHENALALCQQHGDHYREAGAWNNLGIVLHEVQRFDEAITAHETAISLYQQHKDPHLEAIVWDNLGNVLQEVQRFDEAITAHETAISLHKKHKNPNDEATAWENLGATLRKSRRFDEAITAGERAVEMLNGARNGFRTGKALEELAETLAAAQVDSRRVQAVWLRAAEEYKQVEATEEAAKALEEAEKIA